MMLIFVDYEDQAGIRDSLGLGEVGQEDLEKELVNSRSMRSGWGGDIFKSVGMDTQEHKVERKC